jgi:hypothetical protein
LAIAFVLDFTAEGRNLQADYDAVNAEMGVVATPPDGLIFHWAAPSGSTLRVCDVWESQAKFDAFMASTLGPALHKLGFPEPAVSRHEVYNTIPRVPSLATSR